MDIIFGICLIILLLFIIYILLYSMLSGAPYAPIGKEKTDVMLSLLDIKTGDKAVDIGAGDGRIVIALAQKGIEAHGYEINPLLVLLAKYNIRKHHLKGKAFVHWADFWKIDFSVFTTITIYLCPHIMARLEKKLQMEIKKGTRIAVNYYSFPDWKPAKQKDRIFLYTK